MADSPSLLSNALHVGQLVVAHMLAGGIGYSARLFQERLRIRTRRRNIQTLFGLSDKYVCVVHSAVFDEQRKALNFPSSDMQAARIVAHLLETTGRTEGKDFEIVPADEFVRARGEIQSGPDVDIIAICGPKRNSVVATVLRQIPSLRYQHHINEDGHSVFIDRELNSIITATKNFDDEKMVWRGPGMDFGVIQSVRNPFNVDRRFTILAGLHGSGTAAAAQVLSDASRIAEICKRRKGDVIEELVKAIWLDRPEHLTSASLVR